ncbi:protein GAMETE CELL DEFECTIVE 1, mitochondrial-like [Rutidosis leptorrhynchoides]|uniref:protein GAMETE CELL DEFECTIVE 1, mitochondrial-like n=1 Tax=Rutidosis leptorrhynchoides TaxID=125765 RepID=UPI003A992CA9
MRFLARAIAQLSTNSRTTQLKSVTNSVAYSFLSSNRFLSTKGGNEGDIVWGSESIWSSGLTKEHFDGEVVGEKVEDSDGAVSGGVGGGRASASPSFAYESQTDDDYERIRKLAEQASRKDSEFARKWDERILETNVLMKEVIEPGARGAYLKDSEKAEMYRLHKENPEVYTAEKLAKDYRIMRQRVHAILWLKEDEEKMEKKLGHPLDDSVEQLLDNFPQFFDWHDREFHVATLPHKPDFKVMPEGWDGTIKDPDEVLYEISMKEDEILYQEFLERFNFNKMKIAGQVKVHKYSRRRPTEGWEITVEKMGPRGKRGDGGGWKFKSLADGSTRPLNDYEKMFVKREKPRRRRKILHPK